jgi:putative endonuclease
MGARGNQDRLSGWQLIARAGDKARQWRESFDLTPTQALGRKGEDIAHRYLRSRGYNVVARRFRLEDGSGEVDLIARRRNTIIFVEVKTRRTTAYGAPERAVDPEKERKIVRAARSYVLKSGAEWSQVRFDIISVVIAKPPVITHFEDAFFPGRAI